MKKTVMDTNELITFIHEAIKRKYNRAMNTDVIDRLDPGGLHLVAMSLLHEAGTEVVIRCLVMMKMKDDIRPHEAWIDIRIDEFNELRQWDDNVPEPNEEKAAKDAGKS
jgi:predicted GNAT family acetyltransferase